MSDVPVWHMFAYFHDDEDGERDEHRSVAEWRVEDVFRWARFRGYDAILFTRQPGTERYEPPVKILEHHYEEPKAPPKDPRLVRVQRGGA